IQLPAPTRPLLPPRMPSEAAIEINIPRQGKARAAWATLSFDAALCDWPLSLLAPGQMIWPGKGPPPISDASAPHSHGAINRDVSLRGLTPCHLIVHLQSRGHANST